MVDVLSWRVGKDPARDPYPALVAVFVVKAARTPRTKQPTVIAHPRRGRQARSGQ